MENKDKKITIYLLVFMAGCIGIAYASKYPMLSAGLGGGIWGYYLYNKFNQKEK